jgi:hypothetical protein
VYQLLLVEKENGGLVTGSHIQWCVGKTLEEASEMARETEFANSLRINVAVVDNGYDACSDGRRYTDIVRLDKCTLEDKHLQRAVKTLTSIIFDSKYDPDFNSVKKDTVVKLAKNLIAEGVVFPQLKVGDMVYRVEKSGDEISEERVGAVNLEYTIDKGTGIGDVWWLKDYNVDVTAFTCKDKVVLVKEEQ